MPSTLEQYIHLYLELTYLLNENPNEILPSFLAGSRLLQVSGWYESLC